MEHEARLLQSDIQRAHADREHSLNGHEPLYGLAPEPGEGGPGSVGDPSQPTVETPVEEPASPTDQRLNMTWGIVFGGVLLLFIVVTILYLGIGNTYSSAPLSTYPLK
jgi:hypothetical protein